MDLGIGMFYRCSVVQLQLRASRAKSGSGKAKCRYMGWPQLEIGSVSITYVKIKCMNGYKRHIFQILCRWIVKKIHIEPFALRLRYLFSMSLSWWGIRTYLFLPITTLGVEKGITIPLTVKERCQNCNLNLTVQILHKL